MSTKHDCKMVYNHLGVKKAYKKSDSTCDKKVINKIKKVNPKV